MTIAVALGVLLVAGTATAAPQAPAPAAQTPAPPAPATAKPVPFPADAKLGFVDVQAILDESALGKAGQVRMKALQDSKAAELTAKNRDLQTKQQEIQSGQSVWTAAVLSQRTAELNKLQSEMQFLQSQAQTDLEALQEQLLREFQDKVLPIIETLRSERGLWMVLATGGANSAVIAANPGLDLSAEIVKRLDAQK
jgi:outer membrane protein